MYIKPFKMSHLVACASFGLDPDEIPQLGWVVIEHGVILAVGFFRLVEGDICAVEGPYLRPDSVRAKDAGQLLEKIFQAEAYVRGVSLVSLKAYKS